MRILVLLLIAAASTLCHGQANRYTFTLIPASPLSDSTFRIRVTLAAFGCVPLPATLPGTRLPDNVIRYEIDVPDSCFPFLAQEKVYDVAGLGAGDFTFRYVVCPEPQPPQPLPVVTCDTVAEQRVTVLPAASGDRIPAFDTTCRLVTIALVALAGLLGFRQRRR